MAAKSNLGGIGRFFFVVAGLGLAAWGLLGFDAMTWRIVLPAIGGYLLVEGLIGFSALLWAFGRRGEN